MSKREPTIEQNSHFSAKTKQGQDVEFEATLKFYITPSGEVTLSAPGGRQGSSESTVVRSQVQDNQRDISSQERISTGSPQDPNAERRDVDQSRSNTRVESEQNEGRRRQLRDETIDRAFPRGPEHPPGECSIKEFIPDPCKAVDDAVKSIKGIYNNLFSGPKCPPPTNTDNLNIEYKPLYDKSEKEYSEKPAEVLDSNEDDKNKDVMENEQKYDM